MIFGPDWLANIFLFIFFFGLIFTAASLVLGFVDVGGLGHYIGGGDAHLDVGGHDIGGHHAAPTDSAGHAGPGIFNIPTLMAFLTWFGGAGYLFRQSLGFNGLFSVLLAVFSGLVGGVIMFALLAKVLWPMMSKPLSNADYSLPGTPARVVSPIRAGGVGEIVYTKNGTRFTTGARSEDETPVPKGAEVVILRYERGIAYVQAVEAILEGTTDDGRQTTDDGAPLGRG